MITGFGTVRNPVGKEVCIQTRLAPPWLDGMSLTSRATRESCLLIGERELTLRLRGRSSIGASQREWLVEAPRCREWPPEGGERQYTD